VNVERLPRLLQDPYANYVVQKALQVSKKAQFERLVAVIKPHLSTLRNTSFGKRIQSKIMKKFPDLSSVLDHSIRQHQHTSSSQRTMPSNSHHPQQQQRLDQNGRESLSYVSPSKNSNSEYQILEHDEETQDETDQKIQSSNSRTNGQKLSEISDTRTTNNETIDTTSKDSLRTSSASSASWLWSQSNEPPNLTTSASGLL